MAVQLVPGGLQSYSPEQEVKQIFRKKKPRKSAGSTASRSSAGSTASTIPTISTQPMTTTQTPTPTPPTPPRPTPNIINIISAKRQQQIESSRITERTSPTPPANILQGRSRADRSAVLELYRRGGYISPTGHVISPPQKPISGMGRTDLKPSPIYKDVIGTVGSKANIIFGTNKLYAVGKSSVKVYQATEQFVSTKVTRPISTRLGFTEKNINELSRASKFIVEDKGKKIVASPFYMKRSPYYVKPLVGQTTGYIDFGTGIVLGARKQIVEKPVLTAVLFGLGYLGGALGAGATASKGYTSITSLKELGIASLKTGAFTAKVGLGSLYAGTIAYKLYSAPDVKSLGKEVGKTGVELSALYAGAKFASYSLKPVKVTRTVGKVKKSARVSEVQTHYSIDGKRVTRPEFKITKQTLPKREVLITTKLRQKFKFKPLKSYTLPERRVTLSTLYGEKSFVNKPIILAKLRGGYFKTRIVEFPILQTGKLKPIDITSKSLTSIQKKLIRDAIKARVGIPVSFGRIKTVLPKARFYEQGGRLIDTGKISLSKKTFTRLPKQGKFSTDYLSVGIVERGKTTSIGQFFKLTSASKPFKTTNVIASGKPMITKGIVFSKFKVTDLTPRSNTIITTRTGSGSSSASGSASGSTSLKTLVKSILSLSFGVKTPTPRTPPTPKAPTIFTKLSTVSVSAYAGLGLYERTALSSVVMPRTPSYTAQVTKPKQMTELRTLTLSDTAQVTKTKQSSGQRSGQSQRSKQEIRQIQIPDQTFLPAQRLIQVPRQVQPLPTGIFIRGRTPPTQPPPTEPWKFAFPRFRGGSFPGVQRRYTVLGRRFGKFKAIGVARTTRQAFSFGKDWASTTLGTTFKIPGVSGRKLKGFKTKQIKGETLYIEVRSRRLKRGGSEVKEINLYRGLKL